MIHENLLALVLWGNTQDVLEPVSCSTMYKNTPDVCAPFSCISVSVSINIRGGGGVDGGGGLVLEEEDKMRN